MTSSHFSWVAIYTDKVNLELYAVDWIVYVYTVSVYYIGENALIIGMIERSLCSIHSKYTTIQENVH